MKESGLWILTLRYGVVTLEMRLLLASIKVAPRLPSSGATSRVNGHFKVEYYCITDL